MFKQLVKDKYGLHNDTDVEFNEEQQKWYAISKMYGVRGFGVGDEIETVPYKIPQKFMQSKLDDLVSTTIDFQNDMLAYNLKYYHSDKCMPGDAPDVDDGIEDADEFEYQAAMLEDKYAIYSPSQFGILIWTQSDHIVNRYVQDHFFPYLFGFTSIKKITTLNEAKTVAEDYIRTAIDPC